MDFVLRINCDNDAFGENALSRDIEVSYILGRIAQSLEDGKSYGTRTGTPSGNMSMFPPEKNNPDFVLTSRL